MAGFGRGGTGNHTKPKPPRTKPAGTNARRGNTVPDQTPDQTIEEPPVTTTPVRTDDALDDWYVLHLDALAKAADAEQQAIPLESEAQHYAQQSQQLRSKAAELRQEADRREAEADQQMRLAAAAGEKAHHWRGAQKRQNDRAADHGDRIEQEVSQGRQHPRERRQQHTGPQPILPSPLDGPRVPIGPPETQPFPQVHHNGTGPGNAVEAPAFQDGAK